MRHLKCPAAGRQQTKLMKKTFAFALAFGAALTFAACNTQETHDRGLEKPAGTEAGPANAHQPYQLAQICVPGYKLHPPFSGLQVS